MANGLRPGRKNWLFADSILAGQRAAAIMSLIQPCVQALVRRALGVHPYRRL